MALDLLRRWLHLVNKRFQDCWVALFIGAIAIQQGELYHQLQIAHQELEKVYNLAPLTGIPNRRHFDHVLQREWLQLQREQQPLSIIMCDIDYFKSYNDTYGQPGINAWKR